MNRNKELVEVYRAAELEAQVIKGLLESQGIPCLLMGEAAGAIYGLTIDGLGEIRIMVRKEQSEAARRLIKGEDNA